MLFQQSISEISFRKWLLKDKENKNLYLLSAVAIVPFVWIKIVYPFPNFMPPDSYNYLEAAFYNQFINIWPIGYSMFLRIFRYISCSDLLLVTVQYILLQISLLYFLLTLRYLLALEKWLLRLIIVISILNPLLPHIANFVSSDCLFTALSIIWCTQILWMLYRPNLILLIVHAAVLLFAFMVRYNALYYPFISLTIIILSNFQRHKKWIGAGTICILLLSFIGRTQYEYKRKTNTIQFAAFGGWQMAANALYGYAHVKPVSSESIPTKFHNLHKLVTKHMDSLRLLSLRPDSDIGIYYLWDFKSPLRLYMEQKWKYDSTVPFLKKWASVAPLYAEYGRFLILKYPTQFVKHYAWPNMQRYYAPPSYFMGIYNLGNTKVEQIAVVWFKWNSNILTSNTANMQISVADAFTVLIPIINLIFISGLISFSILSGFIHSNLTTKKTILCILFIWISNAIFSIISAPIELRYQLFQLIISLVFAIIFIAYVLQTIYSMPKTGKQGKITIHG